MLLLLRSRGYADIKVKSSYVEKYGTKDAREVGESSIFVVDYKDRGNLKLKTFYVNVGIVMSKRAAQSPFISLTFFSPMN